MARLLEHRWNELHHQGVHFSSFAEHAKRFNIFSLVRLLGKTIRMLMGQPQRRQGVPFQLICWARSNSSNFFWHICIKKSLKIWPNIGRNFFFEKLCFSRFFSKKCDFFERKKRDFRICFFKQIFFFKQKFWVKKSIGETNFGKKSAFFLPKNGKNVFFSREKIPLWPDSSLQPQSSFHVVPPLDQQSHFF